jgi:HD-like signal output (HDOD) protein
MKLTNDVNTFDTELVNYLSEDKELATLIVEKARLNSRLGRANVTASQLRQSIKRLGYGFVHNEAQMSLAKAYAKVYFNSQDEEVKALVRKSIRLAFVARELTALIKSKEGAVSFCAGLNYYIGETILSLRDPRAYKELANMKAKGMEAKTAELTVLGFDLGELASRKLEEWKLPTYIINVVKTNYGATEINEANYRAATIMKFAEYINNSLANKKSGPHAMWDRAYEYLGKLGVSITLEQWTEEIKLMYIKILETEHTLYQRK